MMAPPTHLLYSHGLREWEGRSACLCVVVSLFLSLSLSHLFVAAARLTSSSPVPRVLVPSSTAHRNTVPGLCVCVHHHHNNSQVDHRRHQHYHSLVCCCCWHRQFCHHWPHTKTFYYYHRSLSLSTYATRIQHANNIKMMDSNSDSSASRVSNYFKEEINNNNNDGGDNNNQQMIAMVDGKSVSRAEIL